MKISNKLKKVFLIAWLAVCTAIFIYTLVGNISGFHSVLSWLSRLDNPDFAQTFEDSALIALRKTYEHNLIELSISLCLSLIMYASICALLVIKIISEFQITERNQQL